MGSAGGSLGEAELEEFGHLPKEWLKILSWEG